MSIMDWSEENLLKLIHAYRDKPILWDPKHRNHFKKYVKADAWREVGEEMGITADQCKKKIIILLSSYRREKSRMRISQGKGKKKDEAYVSRWFAYESLKFLETRNVPKKDNLTVLPTNTKEEYPVEESEDPLQSPSVSEDLDETASCTKPFTEETEIFGRTIKRKLSESSQSSKIINSSCNFQTDSGNFQTFSNGTASDMKEDIYDHFGKYIASLLRGIGPPTAFRLQERITSVAIEAICSPSTSSHQPTHSTWETESNMRDVLDDLL